MHGDLSRGRPRQQSLRAQMTRFFGRQDEIDHLQRLLDDVRIVTLTGAPGVGKTRLSHEVATKLAPQFRDGAQLVELAPLAPGSNAADAVADALGVSEQPHRPTIDTLAEALEEAELLLVFDNCEHVVDGAVEVLAPLLRACPGLRMLSTSRTPLRVPGEQVWPVRPLSKQTAVDLFRDRAELADGSFQLDTSDVGLVERICQSLDHLPLAIELTAAWTRVLSLTQIVEHLDDAVALLSEGTHVTTAHHATMEATVDWSYRLLSPADQHLFERLSVCAGGFDLAAVEALVPSSGEGEALRGLTTLVDHSLVFTETTLHSPMRYGLLEPMRQCGEARLAQRGETAGVRRRHAEHYFAVAEQTKPAMRRAQRYESLQRMEHEMSNFRAAITWACDERSELGLRLAIAVSEYLEFSGRVNQGRDWLEDLLRLNGIDQRLRASGLGRLGRLAWRQGDYETARSHLEKSLAVLQELGDELASTRRVRALALVALSAGDLATAADLGDQAIDEFRRHDDVDGLGGALLNRGWVHYAQGDIDAGDECMWEAVATTERTADLVVRTHARKGLSYGAFAARAIDNQRMHLLQARSACEELGGEAWVASEPEWVWGCFHLAIAEGRNRSAVRLAGGALELARTTGALPPLPLKAEVDRRLQDLRSELGSTLTDRLLAQGAAMSKQELLTEALESPPDPDNPLTVREAEVAELVGQGLSNAEIAEKLFISRRTAESHLDHIRQKLGFATRHELMAWVLRS